MKFKYKIFGQDTKIRDGVIEGLNKEEIVAKLQEDGNIIINIEEAAADLQTNFIDKFRDKITDKDIVLASKQLSTLIGGGVQALRSFRLLSTESSSKGLGKRFSVIADDIQTGMPIYKALSRHPDVFNTFYISMVHSGEESGKLKETLEYLANYLERNYELVQKTKKALTYPVFVIVVFIAVMIIMTVFVLPKLADLLTENGKELPFFTKVIMGFSHLIINYWWAIIPGIVGVGFYLNRYGKTIEGKAYFDSIKLKIPVINVLYTKLFLSRFADNINTMLESGVAIVQALQITAEVVDNYVFKKVLERVAEKVRNGRSLSMALAEEKLIPNIMVQMTRIGEETGELGYMLKNIAGFYKRELEQTIDNAVALIEPVMIVAMGIAVGILVGSVIVPMYDVVTSIQ